MSVNESLDIDNNQSNSNVSCNICGLSNNRGLLLNLNGCQRKQKQQQNKQLEANDDQENTHRLQDIPRKPLNEPFYWNEKPGITFVNEINNTYDKFVYWRKNLFLLPIEATGKRFINEITQMIHAWVYDTPIKDIPLKALHVMPAFLLQKPSKNSKSTDHQKSLKRRFQIW